MSLQQEIQRSEDARYDHRLHSVLLVARGVTCPDAARTFGDSPRSVENWVHRYEEGGLAGVKEGERSGRPCRLNSEEISRILRGTPSAAGMSINLWDGKTLSAWIEKNYGIKLGVRQCQRMFGHLNFRLRKPRPMLAKADPARKKIHKKNSGN